MVYRVGAVEVEGDGELNCVKRSELTTHRVLADEVSGKLVVSVQDADWSDDSLSDVGKEFLPELGEIGNVEDAGPDFSGESREHLNRRDARYEELRIRLTKKLLNKRRASLRVVVLHERAGIEVEASH